MGKRKRNDSSPSEHKNPKENNDTDVPFHQFSKEEVTQVRQDLIEWYSKNKRDLPWRKLAQHPDANQRAYAVWVSEIMLQQTQVATVIDYYNKWMKKWPTVQDLAKATLEEVNEMWSGLGYYSRGRRLLEGAKKVVDELDGKIPDDSQSLLKQLPGVGKYTAGAVASIAYNEATGLVDGNVVRVLCRLRIIGEDSTNKHVQGNIWHMANLLVDPDRPGDFNQGLMELGATVCTPKSPDCSLCPLRQHCKAYLKVQRDKLLSSDKLVTGRQNDGVPDIEALVEHNLDGCVLCLPKSEVYDQSLGVMNYPRKAKKKAAREETAIVCVVCKKAKNKDDEFLITQRPEKGLLAGLWEFPSHLTSDYSLMDMSDINILKKHGVVLKNEWTTQLCGEVVHIFSHIHHTYDIQSLTVDEENITITEDCRCKWVTRQQFLESAVSTAMKKVFKAYEATVNQENQENKYTKLKGKVDKNQRSIQDFFKAKTS